MRSPSIAAAAAAAIGTLLVAGSADAATITPVQDCYRYAPNLAGKNWVGLIGAGFTPGTDPAFLGARIEYSKSQLAGYTALASDGSFNAGFLLPDDFIAQRRARASSTTRSPPPIWPPLARRLRRS